MYSRLKLVNLYSELHLYERYIYIYCISIYITYLIYIYIYIVFELLLNEV